MSTDAVRMIGELVQLATTQEDSAAATSVDSRIQRVRSALANTTSCFGVSPTTMQSVTRVFNRNTPFLVIKQNLDTIESACHAIKGQEVDVQVNREQYRQIRQGGASLNNLFAHAFDTFNDEEKKALESSALRVQSALNGVTIRQAFPGMNEEEIASIHLLQKMIQKSATGSIDKIQKVLEQYCERLEIDLRDCVFAEDIATIKMRELELSALFDDVTGENFIQKVESVVAEVQDVQDEFGVSLNPDILINRLVEKMTSTFRTQLEAKENVHDLVALYGQLGEKLLPLVQHDYKTAVKEKLAGALLDLNHAFIAKFTTLRPERVTLEAGGELERLSAFCTALESQTVFFSDLKPAVDAFRNSVALLSQPPAIRQEPVPIQRGAMGERKVVLFRPGMHLQPEIAPAMQKTAGTLEQVATFVLRSLPYVVTFLLVAMNSMLTNPSGLGGEVSYLLGLAAFMATAVGVMHSFGARQAGLKPLVVVGLALLYMMYRPQAVHQFTPFACPVPDMYSGAFDRGVSVAQPAMSYILPPFSLTTPAQLQATSPPIDPFLEAFNGVLAGAYCPINATTMPLGAQRVQETSISILSWFAPLFGRR